MGHIAGACLINVVVNRAPSCPHQRGCHGTPPLARPEPFWVSAGTDWSDINLSLLSTPHFFRPQGLAHVVLDLMLTLFCDTDAVPATVTDLECSQGGYV